MIGAGIAFTLPCGHEDSHVPLSSFYDIGLRTINPETPETANPSNNHTGLGFRANPPPSRRSPGGWCRCGAKALCSDFLSGGILQFSFSLK